MVLKPSEFFVRGTMMKYVMTIIVFVLSFLPVLSQNENNNWICLSLKDKTGETLLPWYVFNDTIAKSIALDKLKPL